MSSIPSLTALVSNLEEKLTLEEVGRRLTEGEKPKSILQELSAGMDLVGDRYAAKDYFLSDLVMAAEIFKQAMERLEPVLEKESRSEAAVGSIVIGTVQGDLHDIGKNIFVSLARNAGFVVNDLGIDVPPSSFIERVRQDGADILGMSGILTLAVDPMRETVELLEKAGLRDRVKVIIGGMPVDEQWHRLVGSDAYTDDAYKGLQMIQAFMQVKR